MKEPKIKYRIEHLGKSDQWAEDYSGYFEGKFMYFHGNDERVLPPFSRQTGDYSFVDEADRVAFNAAAGLPDEVRIYTLFAPSVYPFPVDAEIEITDEEMEAIRVNLVNKVTPVVGAVLSKYKYSELVLTIGCSCTWKEARDEQGEAVPVFRATIKAIEYK